MDRLADKVVFITGIAGGQGRAASLLFAKEGARIIGCDINEAGLAETAELVRQAGGEIDPSVLDLTDAVATSRWIESGVRQAGRIDVLYNNAGNPRMNFIREMSHEDWSFTIRMELDIIFNTVRPAWAHFVQQGGGAIINTASVAGHQGSGGIGQTAHAAKGGA